jgi:hypothetical protein
MIKEENHYLFYSYFLLFLAATYLGREILSPTQHYFILLYQIPTFIILPFIYKQTLVYSRFISTTFFFLSLVLMWEIANFTPFIGLAISTLMYYYFKINLGISWPFVILKPALIMLFIWLTRTSLLLFFNALTSTKEYQLDNSAIDKFEIELLDNDKNNYIPDNTTILFNNLTQILTILVPKNTKSFFTQNISIANEDYQYFFLNNKKSMNPHIKNITVENNLFIIHNEKQNIVLDWNCFPTSLKDIVFKMINTSNEDNIN